MTPDQLRSIFHVEDAAQVPHYEIVQLFHHAPESSRHHVRKRAIRPNSGQQLFNAMDKTESNHEGVRHVKKDLSKNAYESTAKQKFASSDSANKFKVNKMQSSGNDEVAVNAGGVDESSSSPSVVDNLRDDVEVNVDGETGRLDDALPRNHNVSLTAFGEQLHLKLTPTEGLFKNGGPHTLRMWTVKPNPNASQGLDYEEVIEVSLSWRWRIFPMSPPLLNLTPFHGALFRHSFSAGRSSLLRKSTIMIDGQRPSPAKIIAAAS